MLYSKKELPNAIFRSAIYKKMIKQRSKSLYLSSFLEITLVDLKDNSNYNSK